MLRFGFCRISSANYSSRQNSQDIVKSGSYTQSEPTVLTQLASAIAQGNLLDLLFVIRVQNPSIHSTSSSSPSSWPYWWALRCCASLSNPKRRLVTDGEAVYVTGQQIEVEKLSIDVR